MPRHTIPPERDRLQSLALVWIATPTLVLVAAQTLLQLQMFVGHDRFGSGSDLLWAAAVSLVFGLAAWSLRAATPGAAASGALICFLLLESHSRVLQKIFTPRTLAQSGVVPLILLFLLTFASTKLGHDRKAAHGLAEGRRGRNAAQIIANLGVAGFAAAVSAGTFAPNFRFTPDTPAVRDATLHALASLFVPALAALVEATADTVSSEIGQAFGGTPRLLLTLQPVPPGTDGAITLTGTLSGIAAGALVAISAIPAVAITASHAAIAIAAGTAGLFFDSLLGATVERRGWLGNDLVNLSSTAFSAVVAALAARLV